MQYSHLDILESKSIHILRESYSAFRNLCMLWSIGKDSTVLLCLARKAFYGHVPFPLVHVDTHYKIPEMTEYRDRLALEWNLDMIYGENRAAPANRETDRMLPPPENRSPHPYPRGGLAPVPPEPRHREIRRGLRQRALHRRHRGGPGRRGGEPFEGAHLLPPGPGGRLGRGRSAPGVLGSV